jgi:DNA-binding transcriptional LysR family regulator
MQQWPSGAQVEEAIAFATVAEQGSFTRAAVLLGRDATVLSRRITSLEGRLGLRLLQRTTRSVVVTEAGVAFLARVRTVLSGLAEAEASVSAQATGEPKGTLRLALPATFARKWITPRLPEFLHAHPHIRIEASFSNRFVDLVGEGYDAAVRIGVLADSSLVARRIAGHRRILCAAPSYLARYGAPMAPEELVNHACLGFTGFVTHPNWHLTRAADQKRVSIRVDGPLVTDDSEALVQAAVQGVGITMSTDWLVGRELAQGYLVPILEAWSMEQEGGIYAVVPTNRLLPSKTRVFLDWLIECFDPVPWR